MRVRRFAVFAVLCMATVVWGTTVVLAFEAIRRFESTPGAAANALATWPKESRIERASHASTLVMLIHPHCSCSRASIEELAEILQHAPRTMRTFVLVYRPRDFPAGWEQTEIVRAAKAMPRTHVVIDIDAQEAAHFGGFTSGQTFLYDAGGQLRFSGGITSLRGHTGANRGAAEVIRLAGGTRRDDATHPVFGCAIRSRSEGGQP